MGAGSDASTAGDPCQRERALGLINEENPLLSSLTVPPSLDRVIARAICPEVPEWQVLGTTGLTRFVHRDGRVMESTPLELRGLTYPRITCEPSDIMIFLPGLDTVDVREGSVMEELVRAEETLRRYRRELYYRVHPNL